MPFFSVKKIIKIAFFSLSALLKTSIYVIFGKMLKFRGKIPYMRKIFMYFRKNFSYLGKTMVCPEKFFDPLNGTLTEIFLAGGGVTNKKNFKCPFFPKSANQLFEASYAPAMMQNMA